MREEITARADLLDHVHGKRFIVHNNAIHAEKHHLCHFGVHQELAVADGHSHLQHTETINDVGTCQHRQQSGQRLFMSALGIPAFAVPLSARRPGGQLVIAGHSRDPGVEHGQFRRTHYSRAVAQIHCR